MFKHDPRQVSLLADILTMKHGTRASQVVADRVRLWIDAGDEVTASLWTEVGQTIAGRRSGPATKPAPLIAPKMPPRVR
jgi:hypothetical protein